MSRLLKFSEIKLSHLWGDVNNFSKINFISVEMTKNI